MISPHLEMAIAKSKARLRLGFPWWLRMITSRGVIGITIGRRIFLVANIHTDRIERLLLHELEHVRQVNRLGLLKFYSLYLREYVANRRDGMSAAEAYVQISFEREATAAEEEAGMVV